MKWSIQQLLGFRGEELSLDESVDVSEVRNADREIREISSVHVKGSGSVTRELATFTLHISGTMTLPCARTLNDVEYPFSIDAVEAFQLSEWATFDEDEDVHELTSNTVDLMPYVRERILLEKPLRVFSDKPEGPAPESGSGWELQAEQHDQPEEKVDPRMAKLKQLFNDE
ncbi:YceD family protein [Alkalicoccus chagannorensis]|uniref:YceD family protein n=1 Tax=Alkalicoccus chagannorensis TaxID=427072 RepID=UPI0003FE1EFD|nr:YceD family protein [Alkalicoccus chagannorensis]